MLTNPTLNPLKRISPNQFLVALAFGLIALFIVSSHLVIPLSTGVVSDPREFFTTIGSALTGPLGGVLIGILAGIREPNGIELASISAHVIGLIWIGFAYKAVYLRFEGVLTRALLWMGIVAIYYIVFIVPGFVIGMKVYYPDIYTANFADLSVWDAYTASLPTAMPEMLLTSIVTAVAWIALPKRYRKPLW